MHHGRDPISTRKLTALGEKQANFLATKGHALASRVGRSLGTGLQSSQDSSRIETIINILISCINFTLQTYMYVPHFMKNTKFASINFHTELSDDVEPLVEAHSFSSSRGSLSLTLLMLTSRVEAGLPVLSVLP